jgi:Ca-activated chloride channel family protein
MRALALVSALLLPAATAASQIVAPPPCPPRRDCPPPRPIVAGAHIARTASEVRVTLDGRMLRYEITETLVNRGGMVGEADYLLPLPRGAAFEDLALEIDGELVTGEAMTADRARGIYQEIVRKMRDPALVEWMDHGLFRTRIFPIAAGETKRVVVRFRAVAQREGNALRVDYLSSGRASGSNEAWAAPSFTLVLPRGDAYGTPYSPTHQIETREPASQNERLGREVRVRGDASRLTLLVPVRTSTNAIVTTLLHAPPGEDGFAVLTLTPPARRAATLGRDITFVIDVSGSMAGTKMEQARAAGLTLLGTLTPEDRFRLVSFSTDVESFRDGWSPATGDHLRDARRWLEALRAAGSTNIEGALNVALDATARGRLGLVLFLTDGTATVGERNADRLADMTASRRNGQRIFTFGVGADVQAAMLERIALEGRGTAHFVQPNEDVEHAVGVVAQRLTTPVATNIRVRADGVTLRQVHPDGPQDLFVGQDLTLFVRYRGDGAATLTFEGDSPNGTVRWTDEVTFPRMSRDNAFVAKLWAVQRVGWLSAERRRVGGNAELDTELRELGIKYGIPTELTSYLVLEPGMQIPANAPAVPAGLMQRAGGGGGRGGSPANDFAAARVAAEQRAAKSLADAASSTGREREESLRRDVDGALQQIGDRAFVLRQGRWTDTRHRDSVRRVTVRPFSPAYFSLIERVPELKAMFALGDRVTIGARSVSIVVDDAGVEQLSVAELNAIVRDW